jgi:TPR repeat protein
LAWCYENKIGVEKDERKAVRLYRAAADQGHADAQFNLGWCYANGSGVEKNVLIAACLYQMAIDNGEQEYARDSLAKLKLNKVSLALQLR